jgi:hypothetical protein
LGILGVPVVPELPFGRFWVFSLFLDGLGDGLLPFWARNQIKPNKTLKFPTVANFFLCLPEFLYVCSC